MVIEGGAEAHFRSLEHLYHEAPVTRAHGTRLRVREGAAEVSLAVRNDHLHAAGALHGSLLFRVLDDAAFFAANSQVHDVLVLTASFNAHFLRPVSDGVLVAVGTIIDRSGTRFLCRAEARTEGGSLAAWGSGVFVRSRIPLSPAVGYALL